MAINPFALGAGLAAAAAMQAEMDRKPPRTVSLGDAAATVTAEAIAAEWLRTCRWLAEEFCKPGQDRRRVEAQKARIGELDRLFYRVRRGHLPHFDFKACRVRLGKGTRRAPVFSHAKATAYIHAQIKPALDVLGVKLDTY